MKTFSNAMAYICKEGEFWSIHLSQQNSKVAAPRGVISIFSSNLNTNKNKRVSLIGGKLKKQQANELVSVTINERNIKNHAWAAPLQSLRTMTEDMALTETRVNCCKRLTWVVCCVSVYIYVHSCI